MLLILALDLLLCPITSYLTYRVRVSKVSTTLNSNLKSFHTSQATDSSGFHLLVCVLVGKELSKKTFD